MSASPSDSPAEILRTCQELYAALPMKEMAELGRILPRRRGGHGLRWKECADFGFRSSPTEVAHEHVRHSSPGISQCGAPVPLAPCARSLWRMVMSTPHRLRLRRARRP